MTLQLQPRPFRGVPVYYSADYVTARDGDPAKKRPTDPGDRRDFQPCTPQINDNFPSPITAPSTVSEKRRESTSRKKTFMVWIIPQSLKPRIGTTDVAALKRDPTAPGFSTPHGSDHGHELTFLHLELNSTSGAPGCTGARDGGHQVGDMGHEEAESKPSSR